MDLTVITVSMPSRSASLAQALASVAGQVPVGPAAHLVRITPPVGEPNPAQLGFEVNELLKSVTTEWVASLEDDDIWLPRHLASLAPHLTEGVDVVYSYGIGAANVDVSDLSAEELRRRIRGANVLPYCAAIRTDLLREVGGWGGEFDWDRRVFAATGTWAPDWDLWIRLLERDVTVRCVPEVTWEYRQGPQSISRTWRR